MAPFPPYDCGHDDYMFDDASSLCTISSCAGTLQQPSTLASSGSNASVPPSNASFYVARNEASIPAATVMASNVVEKAQTDGVCVSANRKTEKIGKREGQGEKIVTLAVGKVKEDEGQSDTRLDERQTCPW